MSPAGKAGRPGRSGEGGVDPVLTDQGSPLGGPQASSSDCSVRPDVLHPLGQYLGRPVEHGEHTSPSGRAALGRLAPPDLAHPDRRRTPGRSGLELKSLVSSIADLPPAESPPIGDLQHGGVPEGRRPALLGPGTDGVHIIVGRVEEGLELHPGQRPAPGATFVLGGVGGQVLRATDLARSGAELGGARERRAIGRIAQEVAERTDSELMLRMVEWARCSTTRNSPTHASRCPGSHSHGQVWACTRNRRTNRSRASMVTSLRLRASCWFTPPLQHRLEHVVGGDGVG